MDSADSSQKITFSVKNQSSTRPGSKPLSSSLARPTELASQQEDFVTSIGRSGIVSTVPKEKKKVLIIPLPTDPYEQSLSENQQDEGNIESESQYEDDKQRLKESKSEEVKVKKDPFEGVYGLIKQSGGDSSKPSQSSKKQPLLSRSRPKGWKEIKDDSDKLKYELNALPEEPSDRKIPIEEFGNAMLLGMGWKPGQNDGTKVVEFVRRPERLGLGATAKEPPPPPSGSKRGLPPKQMEYRDENGRVRHVKPVDAKLTEKSRFLKENSRVKIVSGSHSGLLGIINRLSSDGNYYIVTLDNDEDVRVLLNEVIPFDAKTESENKKRNFSEMNDKQTSYDTERKDEYQNDAKRAKRQDEGYVKESVHYKEETSKLWVIPFIRVKVKSKSFRGGKYYCKKGVIEDIITGTRCAVRMDDGTIVDDIDQSDLETVIPPVGGRVIVVRGNDIGAKGQIKSKDSSREIVFVQIDDELDIEKFSMDDVSELVD